MSVYRGSGGCLDRVWRVSGQCMEGVWGFFMLSRGYGVRCLPLGCVPVVCLVTVCGICLLCLRYTQWSYGSYPEGDCIHLRVSISFWDKNEYGPFNFLGLSFFVIYFWDQNILNWFKPNIAWRQEAIAQQLFYFKINLLKIIFKWNGSGRTFLHCKNYIQLNTKGISETTE